MNSLLYTTSVETVMPKVCVHEYVYIYIYIYIYIYNLVREISHTVFYGNNINCSLRLYTFHYL